MVCRIIFLFAFFTALHKSSHAQTISYFEVDTLTYFERIGGVLDSIDVIDGVQSSSLPGGGWNLRENIFEFDFLNVNRSGMRFYDYAHVKRLRFSGLPHIGFAYSFGSSGSQFARVEYQQQLKNGLLINLDFAKFRSNGLLRNGNFSHNNVALQLFRNSNKWSFYLLASYASSELTLNDGLLIDSLNNEIDLLFIPVRKEQANGLTQRTKVDLWNFVNFNKDTTNSIGLYFNNSFCAKKFKYSEFSDSLASMYEMVNFDSVETYDQHQWSSISGGSGFYYINNNWKINLGAQASFWNFQNLGIYRDTTELNVLGNLRYKNQSISLQDSLSFNLYGASGNFSNTIRINTSLSKNCYLNANIFIERSLADYYQRYAVGNNYYALFNAKKETRGIGDVSLTIPVKSVRFKLGIRQAIYKDNFWFKDAGWQNDLSSFSISSVFLGANYQFRKLYFQPLYQFSICSGAIKYLPSHQFNMRTSIKANLFKAKKMTAYTGVDFSLTSAYDRIDFLPYVLSWNVLNSSGVEHTYTNLHFFGGFQIEEFKFFIRIENFGSLWLDRNLQIQNRYPLASMQFKVGITWDFFN
jgi:hypothetical protein